MADIAPFRGLRYNQETVPDLSKVIIPPYDVISPAEQDLFHRVSPYNMVQLELGKSTAGDSEKDNPHTRAAGLLDSWRKEGVLLREKVPAIYYYELDFSVDPGVKQTRYGFICALRLEDFARGGVRPHEKTFKAVKDERLGLMLACNANLSSVFALYSDEASRIDSALKAGREPRPVMSWTDRQDMDHRIWRVENPDILDEVRRLMIDKPIFIADGHHRYETALNFRDIQRRRFPEASRNASFEYIMMYLSNMNDDGLTILPTHRMLKNLGPWEPTAFLEKAKDFFHVTRHDPQGENGWRSQLRESRSKNGATVGFYWDRAGSLYLLSVKREKVSSMLEDLKIPRELHDLDVVVLDQVILRGLLNLSEDFLASERNIHFRHDFNEAFAEVRSGDYEACFLINSTLIDQVQRVASAGLIMPHKSTYFYPKVGSGMVIHTLSPSEELER